MRAALPLPVQRHRGQTEPRHKAREHGGSHKQHCKEIKRLQNNLVVNFLGAELPNQQFWGGLCKPGICAGLHCSPAANRPRPPENPAGLHTLPRASRAARRCSGTTRSTPIFPRLPQPSAPQRRGLGYATPGIRETFLEKGKGLFGPSALL